MDVMTKTNGRSFGSQLALWLTVIGAVNWGLVGIADFDLVRAILGGETSTQASALSRIVYAVVGVAGLGLAAVGLRFRPRAEATRVEHARTTA
jgi:uncharacterized membrane protein YuzA (DUF378 family)